MLANFDETYRLWKEQERQIGRQQGRQEGFQENFREGFQEGFREGFQEGIRDVLTQQMEFRFPNQVSEIKKLMSHCQQEDLSWLSMALLQADTAETLEAQLKARLGL